MTHLINENRIETRITNGETRHPSPVLVIFGKKDKAGKQAKSTNQRPEFRLAG